MRITHPRLCTALTLFALASTSTAQWSSNPATNLVVAGGASDQVQPKIVPTPDGGCYISWYDGIAGGFDVRLQRLDADGNEVWPAGGVLVGDRSFSSTQDYGLDIDVTGSALLAFRDDNFSPIQITAQRVTGAGVLLWGASGVQVAVAPSSVAAPKIAGTASGDVVVAWSEGSNGSTQLMRLAPNGATAWPMPVVLTPGAGVYRVSDLHGSGDDAILSIVHQTTGSFLSPKHLLTQKFDSLGAVLWGASPVAVFDGGTLQIGNFPSFTTDGSGGAVFAWYGTGPLQAYAQHILANGTEAFPHNGSVGSTNLTNTHVSPSAAYDAATGSVFMFWEEQNGSQSMSGLSGQRFDAAGNSQWTATGKNFVALSPTQVEWVRTLSLGNRAYVFWIESAGFGSDTGMGAVVDIDGNATTGLLPFSSTPSGKTRMVATKSTNGDAMLAWGDDQTDAGDVLAQNFGPDGSLGRDDPLDGPTLYCTAKLSSAGCTNTIGTSGPQQNPVSLAGDYVVTCANVQGFKNGLVFAGVSGPAAIPFSGGLLCVTPPNKRGPIANSGGTSALGCDGGYATIVNNAMIPDGLDPGAGNTAWYQYWYRDPLNGAGTLGTALSNGVAIDFL